MLSIAKHSSEYWLENYESWDNLFETMSSSTGEPQILPRFPGYGRRYPNCPNCKRMAAADTGGAVVGGLMGAVAGGTMTLGIGTLPGWAAGAVLGGLGASTGEAWNIFIEWF